MLYVVVLCVSPPFSLTSTKTDFEVPGPRHGAQGQDRRVPQVHPGAPPRASANLPTDCAPLHSGSISLVNHRLSFFTACSSARHCGSRKDTDHSPWTARTAQVSEGEHKGKFVHLQGLGDRTMQLEPLAKELSVVVPTYNEVENVPRGQRGLRAESGGEEETWWRWRATSRRSDAYDFSLNLEYCE